MLAVVTGAGSGLGRASALRLGRRGLHVVCVGRTEANARETADTVASEGGGAEVVAADLGEQAGVDAVVDAVDGRAVAALVQCAAADLVKPLDDTTWADIEALLRVNVVAPFLLTARLRPALSPGAGVVLVSSVAARRGSDRHAAYGTSKAALHGMVVHLAAELAPQARVNCVCPGGMDTPLARAYLDAYLGDPPEDRAMAALAADAQRVLLRRIAAPDEVAATVEHLALDASAMTGAVVAVDLGYGAR